jgi:hypothetical protein
MAMTSDFFAITAPASTGASATLLDDLMARVGVDGLTAAFAVPGVLSAVDQHAAGIREAVRHTGGQLTPRVLASYATAVVASARRMGRDLPEPGEVAHLDWSHADWHLIRLVAVCALAEERGWL